MPSLTDIANAEHQDDASAKRVLVVDENGDPAAPGGGTDPVGLKDTGGTPVNPATEDTLEAVRLLLDTVETKLQSIADNTDGLEGYSDGLETLITTLQGYVDQLEGYVDGLEGALATLNAKDFATATLQTTLNGHVDGIETALTTIQGYIDGLESILGTAADAASATGSVHAKLRQLADNTDGIETALTTIQGYVDGIEGYIDTLETIIGAAADASSPTGSIHAKLRAIATAIEIMDDWDESDRAKVNLIAGQVGVQGAAGASTANTQRVAIATDANAVTGPVADDSPASGNPISASGFAKSNDGTTPGAVAENDVARFITDLNRRLYVNAEHPQHWSFHSDGSSALTDSTVQSAPGAGFEIVITEILISTGAATALNAFLEEGSTKILGPWYLEATAGRGVHWRGNKHITPNTAVTITTSAAIAQGIDIQGYIQAV